MHLGRLISCYAILARVHTQTRQNLKGFARIRTVSEILGEAAIEQAPSSIPPPSSRAGKTALLVIDVQVGRVVGGWGLVWMMRV